MPVRLGGRYRDGCVACQMEGLRQQLAIAERALRRIQRGWDYGEDAVTRAGEALDEMGVPTVWFDERGTIQGKERSA